MKARAGRVTLQKARDRIGCRLAGNRVRELRRRNARNSSGVRAGNPSMERQDVGVLAIG